MGKIFLWVLFAVFGCVFPVFGWWDSGHMVIAKIAEERLNKTAKHKLEELIEEIGKNCPDSRTFIEAACWLDDIQNRGVGVVVFWHGHAGIYSPDGFLSDQDIAKISMKYQNNDGVAALQKSIATLKNPQAGKWEKAFMLRVLLHVVGDIHCPMHCVQLYSKQFPEGDKGGVKFFLEGPESFALKHLHSLWDSIILLDPDRTSLNAPKRPLDSNSLHFIEELAKKITSEYPENSIPEKNNTCIDTWVEESFLLGKKAYEGIKINEEPSDIYLEKSQKVACRQIALAGYRLAIILNECFPE